MVCIDITPGDITYAPPIERRAIYTYVDFQPKDPSPSRYLTDVKPEWRRSPEFDA